MNMCAVECVMAMFKYSGCNSSLTNAAQKEIHLI